MAIRQFIIRNKKLSLLLLRIVSKVYFLILINKFVKKGKYNRIINKGSLLFSVKFKIIGNNNIIQLGELSKLIRTTIIIIGNNNSIEIGNNNSIYNSEFWTEDNFNVIHLYNKIRVNGCHFAATEGKSIIVGSDCLFSKEIDIRTGDSHSVIIAGTKSRINPARSVIIEQHVWIGKRVTILKGVTVGSNAIIATNSLVVKDVPSNCIVGGCPARIIKNNVDWLIDRI